MEHDNAKTAYRVLRSQRRSLPDMVTMYTHDVSLDAELLGSSSRFSGIEALTYVLEPPSGIRNSRRASRLGGPPQLFLLSHPRCRKLSLLFEKLSDTVFLHGTVLRALLVSRIIRVKNRRGGIVDGRAL